MRRTYGVSNNPIKDFWLCTSPKKAWRRSAVVGMAQWARSMKSAAECMSFYKEQRHIGLVERLRESRAVADKYVVITFRQLRKLQALPYANHFPQNRSMTSKEN